MGPREAHSKASGNSAHLRHTHTKPFIPELKKIATDFANGEVKFPKRLSQKKAACVRETIRAIKASKDSPKLTRIKE